VWLDDRVFFSDVELVDILAEAVNLAIDDGNSVAALAFMKGIINTLSYSKFAGLKLREYLDIAVRSKDFEVITEYVDFINPRTTKGSDDAMEFLKRMPHAIKDIETISLRRVDMNSFDHIEKQILLESIGQAWISKSMSVSEINWLL
jgi:hypothetical protein